VSFIMGVNFQSDHKIGQLFSMRNLKGV
jgi:hypothetical protein